MNHLLERFAATLAPADAQVLEDVGDYVRWQAGRRAGFIPGDADDVELRTYLLELRTSRSEADHTMLRRKIASLRRFCAWAQAEGLVSANPLSRFDFDLLDLSPDLLRQRQEAQPSRQEGELARLRALNRVITELNRSADVQTALDTTLETLVEVVGLRTAWVYLLGGAGPAQPAFVLAAARGLPSGLEQDDRHYLCRVPDCRCQSLLRSGQLTHAVNIVECSRLQSAAEAAGDTRGLRFHASVPIRIHDQPLGVLNVATPEWQLLSASDLQLLSAMALQIAAALERARLYDLAQSQRLRMERELEMARLVQASLLPTQLPHLPGFSLAADWRSAREVAGDFYDVFPLAGGRWGIVIADVSDKGAPAALYMVLACSLIRSRAESVPSPAALLTQVNQALMAQSSVEMYVTVFYAILDPAARTLTYANAGHTRPILRRFAHPAHTEPLPGGGLVLGMFEAVSLADQTIALAPGDVLVAYTDGLTEAFNAAQEMFGEQRLTQIIRSQTTASAQELLEAIVAQVTTFADGAPQSDDTTVLVLQCQLPAH
jgi:serine phosphatase RsbU (regulator of sigma subunit)